MPEPSNVVDVFLAGAHVVEEAISDAEVRAAWDLLSNLEGQYVSGLAGHLSRGGVWITADYLDTVAPDRPIDFQSAGEYFATFARNASEGDHQGIRERGAEVASVGRDELIRLVHERLIDLGRKLPTIELNLRVAVLGGKVMRLCDYLETRIVEQTVHLDDLARSIGRDPWPISHEAQAITIRVGADIASLRSGETALIRALYRREEAAHVLPVLGPLG